MKLKIQKNPSYPQKKNSTAMGDYLNCKIYNFALIHLFV